MNPSSPLVTIITPSYNQGQFIEATILSVLGQSYPNIQYILVDGDSSDNTTDIINKYRNRIDIVICEKDSGQANAINKGLNLAKGELVGWLNSDDIIYKDCIAEVVKLAIAKPDGVIYYSSKIDFIDREGEKMRQMETKIINREFLLNTNYDLVQPGSLYRYGAVADAGFINENISYCFDLDLWLKLLAKGNIYYYSDKPLAAFRLWEKSKTVDKEIDFLEDIHSLLKRNGMKTFSLNTRKLLLSKALKRIKHSLT